MLAGGAARELTYGITDEQAYGVGLPCGGEIDVYVAKAGRRAAAQASSRRSSAAAS